MGQVQYNNAALEFSDDFSHKDFTGRQIDIPDNTIVYQSCFSREVPDSIVFRPDMTGVQFYNCNLDNCFIPEGNAVIEGTARRFVVQTDARDWELNANDQPVKVINEQYWIDGGYSVDPADIPLEVINEEVIFQSDYDKTFGQGIIPSNSLFLEIPQIIGSSVSKVISLVKADQLETFNQQFQNVSDVTGNNIVPENSQLLEGEAATVTVQGRAKMFNDLEKQLKKV